MTQQILAILWAQWRITRNHLPRTTLGSVLMSLFTALWYAFFVFFAILAAFVLPQLDPKTLRDVLPICLLGFFLYSQTIPLFTLSTGWSLQINKLRCYPIRDSALFDLEVLLRLTTTPETVILILGAAVGLLRRPGIPIWAPFCLLLFIPFNLLLQLAAREFVLHAFQRNRFREVISIFFISIGLIPQLLIRTALGAKLKPYFVALAKGYATPWHAAAALGLGEDSLRSLAVLAAWSVLAYMFARRQFAHGLVEDDSFRSGAIAPEPRQSTSPSILDSFANLFHDPVAALIQKELRSLLRMPRFRVALGMACVFSALLFLPMILREGGGGAFQRNFFPFLMLYALLLLSDALLLNIFGTDRAAVQLYFLTPTPFVDVFRAKNVVAWIFLLPINLLTAAVIALIAHLSLESVAAGVVASVVATMHLMWAGNLISVMAPRPSDPSSTMQRRGNARNQLWILLCTLGMAALVGFAYLARWAFNADWALFAVLGFEFLVGYVIYRVSLDSAVNRAIAEREHILDTLSRTSSPMGGSFG